jgi:pimeloyl-ACP methyl ester carboxylesterase
MPGSAGHDHGMTASSRTPAAPRPTIVIEHGAFADASGWDAVIRRLRRAGYRVIAPANPLPR